MNIARINLGNSLYELILDESKNITTKHRMEIAITLKNIGAHRGSARESDAVILEIDW